MKLSTAQVTLFTIVFRVLMEWIYINYLNDKYPLVYILNFDYTNYILSWSFFVLFNIIVSYLCNFNSDFKVSRLILILLFYMSYIPTSIHFGYADLNYYYFFIFTLYWLLLFIFDYLFTRNKVVLSKKIWNLEIYKYFKSSIYNIIIISSMLLIIITSFKLHGTLYLHFGLQDVYELRLDDDLQSLGTLYSLLLTWAGTVIIPVAALSCFHDKKYIKFLILVFIQLVSFSIAGHKMQLFLIPAGLLASKVLKMGKIKNLPSAFVGLSLLSILEFYLFYSDKILDFVIRRVFFVPALLSSYYVDFFSNMPKIMFFEDMVFSRISKNFFGADPPYDIPASKLIGINYFGKPEMLANNGMFAYGFADAGVIGVIFAAIFLALTLQVLNWLTKNLDISYSGIIIVIFAMSFISVSVSSVIYFYLVPFILMKLFEVNKSSINSNRLLVKK